MLRSALLWASTRPELGARLTRYGFFRRSVSRFMPGEAPDDALRAAGGLAQRGVPTLVTCLGENVSTEGQAREAAAAYAALGAAITERELDMELSVKLTHLGLDLSHELADEMLAELVGAASGVVWLDMEDHRYVDRTLDLFCRAWARSPGRIGLCLQAYLHRTPEDLARLLALQPNIRLVKGAYREPASVAIARKQDVDRAYGDLVDQMLTQAAASRMGRVGVGTHDARLVSRARETAAGLGLQDKAWEIEMLYGIGPRQQDQLRRARTPLRVLISYGRSWFPWYMRRLAERPANLWFVARQLIS